MKEYLAMWKNYANFTGRSTRSEYFLALLCNFIVSYLFVFLATQFDLMPIASLYGFLVFLPSLALQIRRLRDAGKSWAWALLLPVPLLGILIVILLSCKESV
ncbi:MAG: DUF805 domain-containing protein [Faecalibacterium sp.]